MNRLVLSADLVQRGSLRYTPAGVPALDFELQHSSSASEDATTRKVELTIRAITFGSMVQPLQAMALGTNRHFGGFLTNGRNGRGTLFHVTELG